jgi:hypothetical protein
MINNLPAGLTFEADELLNSAIMNKLPVIIVEGCDDIPIYERLALDMGRDCEVYASENILSGKAGCTGVLEHLSTIRDNSEGMDISPFVLGVIDRDARFYRGEIPSDDALLILEFYSIETHFVSAEAVRYLIERTTRATGHLTSEADATVIFDSIKSELEKLRVYSLEALRKACDQGYEARFGYGDKVRKILRSGHEQDLQNKEADLEAFGAAIGVGHGWGGLLAICKGKWLLEVFIDEFKTQIALLPQFCADSLISQCQSCLRQVHKNCLYKMTANFDVTHLQQMLMQDVSQPSFDYIRARFEGLVNA